jgi:hypothetical protein
MKAVATASDGFDWISVNTTFSFSATDTGSGVNATYYRTWHNGTWTNWTVYVSPFKLSGTGLYYIEFYSIDNVGNEEAITNQSHEIDATPPETTKTVNVGTYMYCSDLITDGTEDLNCTVLTISDKYNNTIHCRSITFEEMRVEH